MEALRQAGVVTFLPPEEPPRESRQRREPVPDPIEALADLESQAAAWSREERDVEVEDRALEAYRSVTLAARLVASLGREVAVDLGPAGHVRGTLAAAGDGWAVIEHESGETLVLAHAIAAARGIADGAASAAAWPLSSRRSLAAVLQRLAADQAPLTVLARDGGRYRGAVVRIGADFVELAHRGADGVAETGPTLLMITALASLRRT